MGSIGCGRRRLADNGAMPLDHDRAMAMATYRIVARAVLAFAARRGVRLSAGEIEALADQFVRHYFRTVLPSNDDGEL
jgi:hypothetical protein